MGLPWDFQTRGYALLHCFRPVFSVRGSRRGSTEDFRWDGTDRILREEFNSNWEKLDTQLKALADQGSSLQTALPKITSGTYTGNGSSTRKITLGFTPKAVMITSQNGSTCYSGSCFGGLVVAGSGLSDNGKIIAHICTGDFEVYSTTSPVASNVNTVHYHYLAIG